ncbi:hypothetical protein D7B24_006195 [Verticillium nonalfalfae]|uniref:Transcription factor CBF/NF-Y/archaeal histone domain-containing protein n=1 Tax=Verticillium nonalfalfae TaxID=1051616 RepID=A0A3M9YCK7_9PEZI|nr:uncharacterized protein D7B24_006195 [Verticillium nonalfalfae]RNJ57288.1 hypothetical protein D7B24_006195 [Verticillium nonalfalfae]
MPYNTTAIPPRKEVTGQPALPLARVKKIIAQDPDISICSSNAAFIITVATARARQILADEMFIQHLANEAHNQAKLDRKPRRNVQYKDLANAVAHNDNLEFLEDVIPKTTTYKKIKGQAQATRARVAGEKVAADETLPALAGTKKSRAAGAGTGTNGAADTGALRPGGGANGVNGTASRGGPGAASAASAAAMDDPSAQLQAEMRQAAGADHDGDVDMTG